MRKIKKGFVQSNLGNLISKEKKSIISGPFGSNIGQRFFQESGIPVIRGNNLALGEIKFKDDGFVYLTKDKADELNCYALEGDVVFTAVGTIGQVGIIEKGLRFKEYVISNKQLRVRFDEAKLLPLYAYYWFSAPWTQKLIIQRNVGSTVPLINLSVLRGLPIRHPESTTDQKLIVEVLELIGNKIDLNNRINAELEGMAKLIYDYWFVQFDFPIDAALAAKMGDPSLEGKPYKSSGGKMVWNEELKREIPEGWEVKELGDVIERSGTGLNPRDNFKLGEGTNFYVTIKNIEQGRIVLDDKCDRISDEALAIIDKRSDLKEGDVLFTSIEPVGTTYLIKEKPVNWNINESVFVITPDRNKVTSEYLYMFLSSDYMKAYTNNVAYGSIHKGIRHGSLKACKIIQPSEELQTSFTQKVSPILDKLDLNQKENQKLAELRDWLLPMLMNGQVRVKAEKEYEEGSGELRMVAEEKENYKK